jgi:D-alanyl-D-alanine carboxypeptidase
MRRFVPIVLTICVLMSLAGPAGARAAWKRRIDRYTSGRSISVALMDGSQMLYQHSSSARRAPASGEKLLLSLALLDAVESDLRINTFASATSVDAGVVRGNLWLLGRGDPTVTGGGRYGKELPFRPTRLGVLAKKIATAGITKIRGSVMGATSYFVRDWWATGWKSDFPSKEVPIPTALAFEGNRRNGRHVADPEKRAATNLTKRLRSEGVVVRKAPGAGTPPTGLNTIANVSSVPLKEMLRFMNRQSSNFFAEMFGKRLAVETGRSGSIAHGANAIESWAAKRSVDIDAYDSSGLSYSNRVSARGFVRLLEYAEEQPWWATLRSTLAGADQGTLENRLRGVKLRAKTGTLTAVSSLSGWVWLTETDSWAAFSIMNSGMYKSTAAPIEDKIVREIYRNAH